MSLPQVMSCWRELWSMDNSTSVMSMCIYIYQSKLFQSVIRLLPISSSMLQLESSEQKQIMTDSANWQIYTNRKIIHRSHLADLMKNTPLAHSPAPTPCPKRPPAKICFGACTSRISQIFCLTLLCHPLLQFPPSQRCTGHTSLPWGYTASPFSRSCS